MNEVGLHGIAETEAAELPVCKHGKTHAHYFTADDYPVPGLWYCDGPISQRGLGGAA